MRADVGFVREVKELSPRNQLAPGEVIRVMPAWHCNIVVNGYHYFLTSTAHRRNNAPPKGKAGPSHCIGRVNDLPIPRARDVKFSRDVIRLPGDNRNSVFRLVGRGERLRRQLLPSP